MKKPTLAHALATVRSTAANNGMTFKVQGEVRCAGIQLYEFIDRKSGETLSINYTIWGAYDFIKTGQIRTIFTSGFAAFKNNH